MISIVTYSNGYRAISTGENALEHGNQMVDQLIAILMGWGLAIDDELKGKS